MTEREWLSVLETMGLLWPDREPWPVEAARRCYRLLADIEQEVVFTALDRLKGVYPPSPAALESEVAKVLANVYKPAPRLPQSKPRVPIVDRWLKKEGAESVWEVVERKIKERT